MLKVNAMLQKYPVGIQDFEKIRSQSYLYVDKTSFVYEMANWGGYYFLSRPRRFGKSMLISTLDCLFQGKKELFKGLYIENKWDWEQTYPIIRISFSNIGHKELGLKDAIQSRLNEIAKTHSITLENHGISQTFKELIEKLSQINKVAVLIINNRFVIFIYQNCYFIEKLSQINKVAVLIDEYDKPIIDYLGQDTAKAIENRDTLKIFYSILKDADPHLKMVFITGVSKFSRVSIFSDLNNLQDLTIHKSFSNCCGITQSELEASFKEELKLYDKKKIKEWYNGYTWDLQTKVYNPFSLLNFFSGGGDYKNFWFETGTPTFLINLSKKTKMVDFDGIEISPVNLGSYDIEKLQLLPLMFQTGYLTLKSYNETDDLYTLEYPNREVQLSFTQTLADSYIDNEAESGLVLARNLRNALQSREIEKLPNIFNTLFKSIPYTLWQNENEHFYHSIIFLTFKLLGVYVDSEVQTSDGRIDALVLFDEIPQPH